MNQPRSLTMHFLTRTIILLALSAYMIYLIESDSLHLFIGVRMMPLVQGAAIFILVMGAAQGLITYRSFRKEIIDCSCCDTPMTKSRLSHSVMYSLFILPLLLGVMLPNTVLGSSFTEKKGMVLSATTINPDTLVSNAVISPQQDNTIQDSPSLDQMFVAQDDFSAPLADLAKKLYVQPIIRIKPEIYMEALSSIVIYSEHFIGKEVEISGFVYREPDLAQNQLVLGRIAVQCCTADASPYGVLTEFDGASNFQDDGWISIKGVLSQTEYNGNKIIKIDVASATTINEPTQPYVYPNFDLANASVN